MGRRAAIGAVQSSWQIHVEGFQTLGFCLYAGCCRAAEIFFFAVLCFVGF